VWGEPKYVGLVREAMRKLVAICSVLFLLGLSGMAIAQGTLDGEINGTVINGTAGGGNVSGIDVLLITYVDDALGDIKITVTDDQGGFTFSSLETGPGYEYLVSAHYLGVDYYSLVIFGENETITFVEVPVCETTTSDETIRVAQSHAVIYMEDSSLWVSEYFMFSNDGDRTYVGSEENATDEGTGTLVFTLPQGAVDFEAPQDLIQDCIFLGNSTFADTLPFPPGYREWSYSYRLPFSGSGDATILLKVNYPTDSFNVMVMGDDVEVASNRLTLAGPVEADTGEQFIHLQGEELPRGTDLDIRLSRISGGVDATTVILWLVVVLLIIVIAVLGVKGIKATPHVERESETHKQRLLREIAQLDDEFEQGAIDENTYRRMRSEKKAQLLEMMRSEKGKGEPSG